MIFYDKYYSTISCLIFVCFYLIKPSPPLPLICGVIWCNKLKLGSGDVGTFAPVIIPSSSTTLTATQLVFIGQNFASQGFSSNFTKIRVSQTIKSSRAQNKKYNKHVSAQYHFCTSYKAVISVSSENSTFYPALHCIALHCIALHCRLRMI